MFIARTNMYLCGCVSQPVVKLGKQSVSKTIFTMTQLD